MLEMALARGSVFRTFDLFHVLRTLGFFETFRALDFFHAFRALGFFDTFVALMTLHVLGALGLLNVRIMAFVLFHPLHSVQLLRISGSNDHVSARRGRHRGGGSSHLCLGSSNDCAKGGNSYSDQLGFHFSSFQSYTVHSR